VKKLLLHTCCAPCMAYVYEVLQENYEVTAFFYNPNIMPQEEYIVRLNELTSYSKTRGFPLLIEEPDVKKWVSLVKDYKFMGERSQRCWICYEMRLEKTFQKAKELKFDIVATSLSISPHKDASKINEAGDRLSQKYGVAFLIADFKKNDGVRKSIELSKKNSFYRQNYCGCIYSKLEKNKDSGWSRKSLEYRLSQAQINSSTMQLEFTDTIDLHHFHPADTELIIDHFLRNAVEKKYKVVKIIHGKGKSVKKRNLYKILKVRPEVVLFRDDSDNWGATIVEVFLPK